MGHRITRAASHLSVDEVKERMKTERRPWVRHHWWIIYNALVAPRKADDIALPTGVSATTVHRVIARSHRVGPAAIEQSAKGGRHHAYLTLKQEQAFLPPFFARAERGEIATVEQIHQAFEVEVQHEVHIHSIYRLLQRHGRRKLVPRSRHPKANQEEPDAVQKKTSSKRSKRRWPAESPLMSDRCSRGPKTKAALGASASPDEPGLPLACGHTPCVKSFATLRMCMPRWLPPRAK